MLPNNNNLVRDIIPPVSRPVIIPKSETRKEKRKFFFKPPPFFKFLVSAVVLYVAILMMIDFFAQAEIKVLFKSEVLELDNLFSAAASDSEILIEKVIFEEKLSSLAKTSAFKDFNERASGAITIFNAYSSEPQVLAANTRFETPDGRVYRINKSLVVPGAKIIDGQIEPSSIEAMIFADEPGEAYNIGLNDFTIPGFKGSVKYEKFYGRSKTPMSGGFVGRAKVVGQEDLNSLRRILEEELKRKLYNKMQAEVPDKFLVPEEAYQYEIKLDSLEPSVGSPAEAFKLTLSGALRALFIEKSDVKKKILERFKDDPYFESMDIMNFNDFVVAAVNADFESPQLKFKVSGQAKVVWGVESRRLAAELALAAGADERLKIFEQYPQIRKAEISYHPSWWKIFPDTADKVVIHEAY